ncbi:hypothetical protein [Cohnella candidum]|uniref:TNase-like domain-containing protein n=1 Tax=Cohnella candidum TaxID=2674991 RepID=A0A3G3JSX1_9BACL|nr:hypothetical protein [Cohnella candidum]AYQ71325.1 hypothetical protein EAV92_01200 [Cohnella candidum]
MKLMLKPAWLCLAFLFLIGLTACRDNDKPTPVDLNPITLAQAYPGDILKTDRIELLDGSTGETRTVEDPAAIREWLTAIKNIRLIPDDNQEGRAGYRFGIQLFQGEELKLGFIPNSVQNVYYESNEELETKVQAFFETQFGRKF